MTITKKLSVIIPLYNVEAYVSKAADSIASQAFDGLEVIVVDDGSTDNSLEVCMNHLRGVDVIVISQENKGLSGARNAGILTATGDYIMFLDSDDFLLPNSLNKIVSILESKQPDVVFGRYLRWSPTKGFSGDKQYCYNPPSNPLRRTEYILSALPEHSWNAVRYICRRNLILEHKLFFELGMICEDVPWVLSLLECAETIEFIGEPFYAYYLHRPGSILNRMDSKRLTDLNAIVSRLIVDYAERPVICRQLIWQSFLYINEYCCFGGGDRKRILESYRKVLPLYGFSDLGLHRVIGKCMSSLVFYGLSLVLFWIKRFRRLCKA